MNRTLWPYIRDLAQAKLPKAALTLTLMIVLGLMEGVGLLMLAPLLQLIGLDTGSGALARIAESLSRLFAAAGLPTTLLTVLAAYVVIISLYGLLSRWETTTSFGLQYEFMVYLRDRLYRAIANCNWLFFARSRASDFAQALTNEVDRVGMATYHLLLLGAMAITTSVYILLALRLSPVATGLVFICGGALLGLLWKKTQLAHQAGGELSGAIKGIYAAVLDHLGGMKTARSYGAEQQHIAVFAKLTREVGDKYARINANRAETKYWFDLGAAVVLSTVVYVTVEVLKTPTAELLLLLFLFARIIPRFSQMQQLYQGFANHLPAYATVARLQQQCEKAAEPVPAVAEPVEFRDTIELEHVAFSYDRSPVIRDLDLTIHAGETCAIVGPSGVGKTTVADLVMGLILPDKGRILVDSVPLDPQHIKAWRSLIGYVAQDTFLFHDSIRANLLWAQPDAKDEDVLLALKLAAADGFVADLPEGLDTVVGDRGVRLSGGEKQRLALARALLRKPALLILDEATSNLDVENENRILSAIETLHGRLTILLITHRLAAVRRADIIHVIEEGCIVESGDWENLTAKETGRFRALCNAQGINSTTTA